jgi:hypothetical protein
MFEEFGKNATPSVNHQFDVPSTDLGSTVSAHSALPPWRRSHLGSSSSSSTNPHQCPQRLP